MSKYPDKILLYRGVDKEEADIVKKTGEISKSKRYRGVSHWTTSPDRANKYADYAVLCIEVEVDKKGSKITGASPTYPELKNKDFRKIGGNDYAYLGASLKKEIKIIYK